MKRRTRVNRAWRDLRAALGAVWLNLLLYSALLVGAAAFMRVSGIYRDASFLELILGAFQMSHLEGWAGIGDGPLAVALTFVVPAMSIGIIGEGAMRVLVAYVRRNEHQEEWDLLLAHTFTNHTVICGVGELGRAVYKHLITSDPEAQVVLVDLRAGTRGDLDLHNPNVCQVQADMTTVAALEEAGCRQAKLIILASGNDATNLEAGFRALQLNPKAEIWIRLYRSGLAVLLDLETKPNVHLFCPYERAAEALVAHVLTPGGPKHDVWGE
jgi:hypothetical protein